jgi:hypothetical protein
MDEMDRQYRKWLIDEICWLGGFVTGAGSFGIDYSWGAPRPKFRATYKDREPLERLKGLAGGCIFPDNDTNRYVLVGRPCAAFSYTIWSFVSELRKREIATMIRGWLDYVHQYQRPQPKKPKKTPLSPEMIYEATQNPLEVAYVGAPFRLGWKGWK